MDNLIVPKLALRTILNSHRTRYTDHIFTGNCKCPECALLRCWPVKEYDDYLWLVLRLNTIRGYSVRPMAKDAHAVTLKLVPNFKIDV